MMRLVRYCMGAAMFGIGLDELAGFHDADWPRLGLAHLVDQLAELNRSAQQAVVERELLSRLKETQARRDPVQQLLAQIEEQQQSNDNQIAANELLRTDVHDLKTGLEAVEEHARLDLGLIKPNETFVQISTAPTTHTRYNP